MLLKVWRRLAVSSAIVLLAACGGGGGGSTGPSLQSPPSTAATLSPSATEATEALKAINGGGSAIAKQDAGPDSLFLPTGDPFSASSGSAAALYGNAAGSGREQPMAVTNVACTSILPPPCSGSLSLDTNLDPNTGSATIPAGVYLSFSFNALQGSFQGKAINISGTLRVDFLTTIDINASSFANSRFQVLSLGLGGSIAGEPFGRGDRVALVEFDAQGGATLTTEGMSFSRLSGITVTDTQNYIIGTATLRHAHWGNAGAYVDYAFQSWAVSAGRPTAGSQVTVSAGAGTLAAVVTASSASTVVYDVQVNAGGSSKRYTVTATYPAGGGAPVYAAIDATI